MIHATTPHVYAMQLKVLQVKARKAQPNERFVIEDAFDNALINFTPKIMREALAKASSEGKRGWWNAAECTTEHLRNLLATAVQKADMVSVMNYAAMIYAREITEG